jgi:lipopolysaccharide export system protein LptC
MIDRAGILFPLGLLGALAALSFALKSVVHMPVPGATASASKRPDSILENFTATRTDEQGRPRYRLSAARMNHFLEEERTELIEPRFVQASPNGEDLRVRSSHALVTRNGEQVVFAGQVEATRSATPGEDALKLVTSHLTVHPEHETMTTQAPVAITSARWNLSGVGMRVDAKARVFKLLSRVKGSHAAR